MSNQGHNAVPGRQGFQRVSLGDGQRASAPAPSETSMSPLSDWREEGFDAEEAYELERAGIGLPLAMDYMEAGTHAVGEMIERFANGDLPAHDGEVGPVDAPAGFEPAEPCPDCGSVMVHGDADGYLHVDRTRGCWLGRNERELSVGDRAAMAVAVYVEAVVENGTVGAVLSVLDGEYGWAEIADEVVESLEHASNGPAGGWVDAVRAASTREALVQALRWHT